MHFNMYIVSSVGFKAGQVVLTDQLAPLHNTTIPHALCVQNSPVNNLVDFKY